MTGSDLIAMEVEHTTQLIHGLMSEVRKIAHETAMGEITPVAAGARVESACRNELAQLAQIGSVRAWERAHPQPKAEPVVEVGPTRTIDLT